MDVELYDHELDPRKAINVAKAKPEKVVELLSQFNKGWKGSLPQSAVPAE